MIHVGFHIGHLSDEADTPRVSARFLYTSTGGDS
jgi:hypothetical protein